MSGSSPAELVPLVLAPGPVSGLGAIEDALTEAFVQMRDAVAVDRPVVVMIDDRDLGGDSTPARAAFAHGLLGLARAFGIEGRRRGWRISAVSATEDIEEAERRRWAEQLAASEATTGTLVRLGGAHLGKVPV